MREVHFRITPSVVHHSTKQILTACLDWKPYHKSVSVDAILQLLLLITSTGATLFDIVRRRFVFSHETGRRAVYAQLGDSDRLTAGLANALHQTLSFSRRDRRRRWIVAIDTHHCPYYGERSTPGIIGGQKKEGTNYFYGYATAILIHKRRRFTVGLIPLRPKIKPHQIVQALFDQIDRSGLLMRGVVLDSGFDGGETLLLLQQRSLDYTVPLRRKGKGTNQRNACFDWPGGTVGRLEWKTEDSRRTVSTAVLVWRGKNQPETRVYAFSGWGREEAVAVRRRAWLARRRYRERFAIETSYRQKNQGLGWTTSKNPVYRLLLEGLAHLVRQIWVALTQQIARSRKARPTSWIGELPLPKMLEWLADLLKLQHPENRSIPAKKERFR